jgi:DNA invertase Pin-like site-specific DNA recombinase
MENTAAVAGASIGYVRVSTDSQKLDLQMDAMERNGVTKVFSDLGISGSTQDRKGLNEALAYLRSGDTLVVYSLSRLARNTKNLLQLVEDLEKRNIKIRSITEGIDTSGPFGKMLMTMIGAIATLERDILIERTSAGIAASRKRGVSFGAPKKLSDKQHTIVRSLYDSQTVTIKEIAAQMNVSEQTIYRSLRSTKPVPAEAMS